MGTHDFGRKSCNDLSLSADVLFTGISCYQDSLKEECERGIVLQKEASTSNGNRIFGFLQSSHLRRH